MIGRCASGLAELDGIASPGNWRCASYPPNGTIYTTGNSGAGLFASTDQGTTWTSVPGVPSPNPQPTRPVASATQLFVQVAMGEVWVAPFSDLSKWTMLSTTGAPSGGATWLGGLQYDEVHGILYLEDFDTGVYRYVVP